MRRRGALAICGWAVAGLAALPGKGFAAAPSPDDLFDAAGFRQTRYRAPVDRDPAPAATLPLAQALALHPGRNALFLDVLPAEGAQRDPATGAWRGAPRAPDRARCAVVPRSRA